MPRKKKYRTRKLIGFYTDEEGRVRPITKGVGILRHPVTSRLKNRKIIYRSQHALAIDKALKARVTEDPEKWMRNPNRYDFEGIDTGTKTWKRSGKKRSVVKYPELKEFDLDVYGSPMNVALRFINQTAKLNKWRKTHENDDSVEYGYYSARYKDEKGNLIDVDVDNEGKHITFTRIISITPFKSEPLAEANIETYYKKMEGMNLEGEPETWWTKVATIKIKKKK